MKMDRVINQNYREVILFVKVNTRNINHAPSVDTVETIFGSDNGLSPAPHQAIIWTNAGILLIGPLRTNFSEMSIEIHTFSFKKMHLKKCRQGNGGHFVLASMC